MAKYYIESGNLQLVVHAKNSKGAALWAVHRSLARLLPFVADESRQSDLLDQEQVTLGETITASERGFGRPDAQTFDTFDVVTEWNQLMVALERLESFATHPVASAG
jgi:hypothetical protein